MFSPRALLLPILFAAGCALPACNTTKSNSAAATSTKAASTKPPAEVRSVADLKVDYDAWARIGYRLDWVGFPFPGASPNSKPSFIDMHDDAVFIQDSNSTVSCVEASNGAVRWSNTLAGPLTKFVAVERDASSPDRVYVASESELFTLGVGNGNLVGRERFSRVVNTRPVFEGNLAIFGCSNGEVMAHMIGRNLKAWGFGAVGAIDRDPVRLGESIVFITGSGDIPMLNSGGRLAARAHVYQGVDTDPVSDGERVFIAGRDQSIWSFDAAGGLQWRHRTSVPLTVQPTAWNNVLYCEIPGEGLHAFESSSGTPVWSNKALTGTVIGSRSGNLLVWNGSTLSLVDVARGDVISAIELPGIRSLSLQSFDDGTIYAVTDKLSLAKFLPR